MRLMELYVELSTKGFPALEKTLKGTEERSEATEKNLKGLEDRVTSVGEASTEADKEVITLSKGFVTLGDKGKKATSGVAKLTEGVKTFAKESAALNKRGLSLEVDNKGFLKGFDQAGGAMEGFSKESARLKKSPLELGIDNSGFLKGLGAAGKGLGDFKSSVKKDGNLTIKADPTPFTSALKGSSDALQSFKESVNKSGNLTIKADNSEFTKMMDGARGSVVDFKSEVQRSGNMEIRGDASSLLGALDNTRSSVASLKNETQNIDIEVDRDGAAAASLQSLSGGFHRLAGSIRDVATVGIATTVFPAMIAGLGALPALAFAAAGAVGQLAIALGQGLAGAYALVGTAFVGARVGLMAYTSAISSTITASREAYTATHAERMELIAKRREQILTTASSNRLNTEINESTILFSRLQAAIGNKVFPAFTRELDYWNEYLREFSPQIAQTAGKIGQLAAGFSEFVRTAQKGQLLRDIFSFVNGSAVRASTALDQLGRAGLRIFQQLIPGAERLQKHVVSLARTINEWVESSRGMKTIQGIITQLEHRFYQLVQIVRDFGAGIINVFRALNADGGPSKLMAGLQHLAAAFRNVMQEGNAGFKAVRGFMQDAQPALNQVYKLAGEAAKQIGILASQVIKAGQSGSKMGTLAKIIKSLRDSLAPIRKMLAGTFEALGPVLAKLIPQVAKFMQYFLGSSGPLLFFLRQMTNMLRIFNSLPPSLKTLIVNLLAFKTIVGSLGVGALSTLAVNMAQTWAIVGQGEGVFAKLGTAIKGAVVAIGSFLTIGTGGTIVLIAGILAGIAAAAFLVYKNWDKIKKVLAPVTNAFKSLWKQIAPFVKVLRQNLVSALKQMARGLLSTITPGKRLGTQIQNLTKAIGRWIKEMGPKLIKAISAVSRWLKQNEPLFRTIGKVVGTVVVRAFKHLWGTLKLGYKVLKGTLEWLDKINKGSKDLGTAMRKTLLSNLQKVWNYIKDWAKDLKNAIGDAWDWIKKSTQTSWNIIKAYFKRWWNNLTSAVKSATNAIKNVVDGAWKLIKRNSETVWNAIKAYFKRLWNAIESLVSAALKALSNAIKSAWNAIKKLTEEAWEAVKKFISEKIETARKNATKTVEALRKGLSEAWKTILKTSEKAWEAIKDSIWEPIKTAYGNVKNWLNKLIGLVNGVLKKVGLPTIGGGGGNSDGGGGRNSGSGGGGGGGGGGGAFARGGIANPRTGYTDGAPISPIYMARGGRLGVFDRPGFSDGVNNSGPGYMTNRAPKGATIYEDNSWRKGNWTGKIRSSSSGSSSSSATGSIGISMMARGGKVQGPNGGLATNGPRVVYGEAGPESYVTLGRYTHESAKALEVANRTWAARGWLNRAERDPRNRREAGGVHGPNPGHRTGPIMMAPGGQFYPKTDELRRDVLRKHPGIKNQGSTYAGHGADGDSKNSIDFQIGPWGQVASSSQQKVGNAVVNYILKEWGNFTDYIIWNKYIWDSGGKSKYRGGGGYSAPSDPSGYHQDHVHEETLENNPGPSVKGGTGAGGTSGASLMADLFERLWGRIVQPVVDRFIDPLKNDSSKFKNIAGAAAQMVPDGIYEWALSKLGGSGGSGGDTSGNSPKGLTASEVVKQAGFASNQHKNAIGVMWEESGMRADATNGKYRGLYQMGDAAFREVGMSPSKWRDPIYNATGAAKLQRKMGWAQPWAAWPVSNYAKNQGNRKITGYDVGGLIKRDHMAQVHANELVMPLDNQAVARQVQVALGTGELRREIQELRHTVAKGLKNVDFDHKGTEKIVQGSRNAFHNGLSSQTGQRQLKQVITSRRFTGFSGVGGL